MKKILVLGAGKSATSLIHYLLERADQEDWTITVGDRDLSLAEHKVEGFERGKAIRFDVDEEERKEKLIAEHDIIVSLLPAFLHPKVSKACLKIGRHIITPSYVSADDLAMSEDFAKADLLFMGEMGLDPGIDHMSTLQIIHDIENRGGNITAVRSFTGGLIAPESDNNPWNYKFTWSPINVVLAGQGTAQYLKEGKRKYVPYNRLFSLYETYSIPDYGAFEVYANRDSIIYLDKYELKNIPTFIRGTMRREGFCDAWNAFVKLGLTDNGFPIVGSSKMTYNDLIEAFLPGKNPQLSLQQQLAEFLGIDEGHETMKKLAWLGLFDNIQIPVENGSPAMILKDLLEPRWKLEPDDKDMIAMLHLIDYELNGEAHRYKATLVVKGQDAENTAMSHTVGWPLGIMVRLLSQGKIKSRGVKIPIMPEVYEPVLKELESFGVVFTHQDAVVGFEI